MPYHTLSQHAAAASAIALMVFGQTPQATAQNIEERTFYNGQECTPFPLYDIHDTARLQRLNRTEQSYVDAEGFAWWRNFPYEVFCPITRRASSLDPFDVTDLQGVFYVTGAFGGPANDYEGRLCLTPYVPSQGSRCGTVDTPSVQGAGALDEWGHGYVRPPDMIPGDYIAITAYLNVRRSIESNEERTVGRLHHYWSYSRRDAAPRRTALRLQSPSFDGLATADEGEINVNLSLMDEIAKQASEATSEALEEVLSQSTGMEARAETFSALLFRQSEAMEINLAEVGMETSCGEVFCVASFDLELDQSVSLRLGFEQPCEFWAVAGRDAQHLVTACK